MDYHHHPIHTAGHCRGYAAAEFKHAEIYEARNRPLIDSRDPDADPEAPID